MGDLHSGSGATKIKFDNSHMHTIHNTYVFLVQLVPAVDLLWVVVGLQMAGCQQWSQLAWMLAGYQLKQVSREADIGWLPEYHQVQLSMPTGCMQHTVSINAWSLQVLLRPQCLLIR